MSRAHIAAMGARTPVGLRADTSAAAVRAGISRIREHPSLLDLSGAPIRCAMDGRLDPEQLGWTRYLALVESALLEVCATLGASGVLRTATVDLYLCLPEPRPGWTVADAQRVGEHLRGWRAPSVGALRIVPCQPGHAGALAAMGDAVRRISARQLDLCIVGGVDGYLELVTLDWLYEHRQLACENVRGGFFPGEAAGFVALASTGALRELRLAPLCTIAGAHAAMETKLIRTDAINLASALTEAVAGATAHLQLPHEAVDAIYCDINGERYRSEEWGFVALKLPHVCRDSTVYEAPSASWGDVGAATGALLTILAVQAWQRRYARGPSALLWAGSEAGLRAAVLLHEDSARGGV
jgi:3-oxoacyl-[acyl-carrier-protein] synthase I